MRRSLDLTGAADPTNAHDIMKSSKARRSRRIRVGVFFSHPTQHHSILFQRLSGCPSLDVSVYYYDPGSLGNMYNSGFASSESLDVDLLVGTRHRFLYNLLRWREPRVTRQVNPGVIPAIVAGRFDAVMLFGYVSPSNRVALRFAKATGAEVLYQSDTNIFKEQRTKRSRLIKWYRDSFVKRADTILVVGDRNRDAYLSFGVDERRLLWCPYPVDVERLSAARSSPELPGILQELRQRYQIPSGAKVVAFCGRLIPRKRPGDLIEALRKVGRRDVYGLIIGSGPLESELRQTLTNDDQVRITGFVNQSSIPHHLLMADIGVVTSDRDAHPLVTTEFAACGVPVLVSDRCGVWGDHDILRPGENGQVYKSGDVPALARGISQLLDDALMRARMSARALELAETQSAETAAAIIVKHLIGRAEA